MPGTHRPRADQASTFVSKKGRAAHAARRLTSPQTGLDLATTNQIAATRNPSPSKGFHNEAKGCVPRRYFGSMPSTPMTRAVAYLPSTFSSQGRTCSAQVLPEVALFGYTVISTRLASSLL